MAVLWLLALVLQLIPAAAAEFGGIDAAHVVRAFPGAVRAGTFEGTPPAAPVYSEDALLGYVFRTRDVVASSGFSGKPLDILVGLDLEARIMGAAMIEHHEPILVIGVEAQALDLFLDQYRGRGIRAPIGVLRRAGDRADAVDAVAGATISSVAMGDVVVRAARAVARSRGLFGDSGGLKVEAFSPATWPDLLADGSLAHLRLSNGDIEGMFTERGARLYPEGAGTRDPADDFIDLYVALATPSRIGRNLVGERLYSSAMASLSEGDQLLFVAARGLYSFKGSAYRRSGVFDRMQLDQGAHTVRFYSADHIRVDRLEAADAPDLREMALFVVRASSGFDAPAAWRLSLMVEGMDSGGGPALVTVGKDYGLPASYVRAPTPAVTDLFTERPLWQRVWLSKPIQIGVLSTALAVLTALLVFQDVVARRPRLHRNARLGFLIFTLVWLGWYAGAQLSVLNVLSFAEALRTRFDWEFFLLDPLLFILWSYVAVAMLFWGRGVFCGWLCPFGALQELSNRLGRLLGVPQARLPFGLHERLWPIKYVIFLGLFALSLSSLGMALVGAEIEPFKTAIILKFDRPWPFVLFAGMLVALSMTVERAFCRYVCPLGAALAIPARLRMFEWLKRRPFCGSHCQICARRCPVQAIHPDGHINPNECIHCLSCQVTYFDAYTCPPLIERRKRREMRPARKALPQEDV